MSAGMRWTPRQVREYCKRTGAKAPPLDVKPPVERERATGRDLCLPAVEFVVELPLPPVCCSPNYNAGKVKTRIQDNQRKAAYRAECAEMIRQAIDPSQKGLFPYPVPVHIRYEWYHGRGDEKQRLKESLDPCCRPRDIGNAIAACKVATDALIDAGVLIDDDYKHVSQISAVFHYTQAENAGRCGLVLILQPLEEKSE